MLIWSVLLWIMEFFPDLQGYQFWCRADADGSFYIKNIVTGNYNLYAWVPGFIGDYRFDATLTISSG